MIKSKYFLSLVSVTFVPVVPVGAGLLDGQGKKDAPKIVNSQYVMVEDENKVMWSGEAHRDYFEEGVSEIPSYRNLTNPEFNQKLKEVCDTKNHFCKNYAGRVNDKDTMERLEYLRKGLIKVLNEINSWSNKLEKDFKLYCSSYDDLKKKCDDLEKKCDDFRNKCKSIGPMGKLVFSSEEIAEINNGIKFIEGLHLEMNRNLSALHYAKEELEEWIGNFKKEILAAKNEVDVIDAKNFCSEFAFAFS